MEYFKRIITESILIVIISSIIGIFTGSVLTTNLEILYGFPIITIILPALNSLTGDIATVLISRLTTHLYIGIIPPKVQSSNRLLQDFIGLLGTILLGLLALILLGYGFVGFLGMVIINPFLIISSITLTVFLLFMILFIGLFISSITLFKKGKDPNNFLIPFTTSLADFLTPLLLMIFIQIFI
ncbi:MAG: magnesium transporter [Candidatus Thorarchaeota archaeon]